MERRVGASPPRPVPSRASGPGSGAHTLPPHCDHGYGHPGRVLPRLCVVHDTCLVHRHVAKSRVHRAVPMPVTHEQARNSICVGHAAHAAHEAPPAPLALGRRVHTHKVNIPVVCPRMLGVQVLHGRYSQVLRAVHVGPNGRLPERRVEEGARRGLEARPSEAAQGSCVLCSGRHTARWKRHTACNHHALQVSLRPLHSQHDPPSRRLASRAPRARLKGGRARGEGVPSGRAVWPRVEHAKGEKKAEELLATRVPAVCELRSEHPVCNSLWLRCLGPRERARDDARSSAAVPRAQDSYALVFKLIQDARALVWWW
mmetsp:Transcript_2391/g.7242  ORF Transcript_2391/g.7242 Transcript_2391/m.7242 type:complete len:315 (-) Transcript_2391:159-1103(-)